MNLKIHDTLDYSVIKFPTETAVPKEFSQLKSFKSITYTEEECSVIVPTDTIDLTTATAVDAGWFIIQIVGELDFSLVGILTQLANPLAENGISIFALSTYNTDYLLIKTVEKEKTVQVLTQAGHVFE
ncbi:ACT domain-containing protein [Enterococcus sp. BWR-S5]|uniref:ACT domain-containing protein n=1 Tax=Enterococcus sp. BWR-S5 TaxID=2787714 RepID=UPI001922B2F5|nr:ACT domain-containing protein [Enterococcus sp. BWR-S5]MBL1225771.1 ACT domain-containing protein [Enterococcus sp. BWR-S5]